MTKRQEQRLQSLLETLNSAGRMSVSEICETLNASPATVRRTLEHLQEQGLIIRTHGGAMLPQQGLLKPPFVERIQRNEAEKIAIARAAVKMVERHETIFITGGSTTYLIARILAEVGTEVTVITNAANVAVELTRNPKVRTIILGGEVGDSYSVGGDWVEAMLQKLPMADQAFIGADGVSLDYGVSTYNKVDAHVHKLVAARTRRTIIVADHSKFGVSRFYQMFPVSSADVVITDEYLPTMELSAFRAAGINLVLAPIHPKIPT